MLGCMRRSQRVRRDQEVRRVRGSRWRDGRCEGGVVPPSAVLRQSGHDPPRAPLTDNKRRRLAAAELRLRASSRRRGSHVSLQ